MPAYISHAIMGEELYDESYQDDSLFKVPITKEELRGYSLGVDLSILSKNIKSDPQNEHTKEFFLTMIEYIKENKLIENIHIMALLYGHIGHYYLDTLTHPFIYYIERGCEQTGPISNHNLVEGYLSSYLTTQILSKDIMDIKPSYFNQINLKDSEINNIINTIYGRLYGDFNMIKTYKKTLQIFTTIETILKSKIVSKKVLMSLSGFLKFIDKNSLALEELTNEGHNLYQHPITGTPNYESFIDLYKKSIQITKETIFLVNKYLYSDAKITELESIFQNLSYDTGLDCSLGTDFQYVKKRTLK